MKKIILSVIMVFAFANMAIVAQTPAKKSESKTEQSCDPCSGCKSGCCEQQKSQCHGVDSKKADNKKADTKKKDVKKECKTEKKNAKSGCCSK